MGSGGPPVSKGVMRCAWSAASDRALSAQQAEGILCGHVAIAARGHMGV